MEGCGGEWFGVSVPRLFLFVGALHPNCRHYTSSVRVHRHVTGAPLRNGCSAPYRVQRPRACGGCGGCRGCGGLLGFGCLLGLSCLLLGLSSAWGLCGTSCCGSSEMSHVIPRHVFQTLKSHRWNSAVFSIPMKSSGTRITCEFWLMRRPRRTPVFGHRPTTLSTIPGTLRTPPPHPTMRRAGLLRGVRVMQHNGARRALE